MNEIVKKGIRVLVRIMVLVNVDKLVFIILNYGHLVCYELRIDD